METKKSNSKCCKRVCVWCEVKVAKGQGDHYVINQYIGGRIDVSNYSIHAWANQSKRVNLT